MPVQVSADEWTNYLSIKKKEKGKKKFGYFLNYLEQASRVPLCPSCRPVPPGFVRINSSAVEPCPPNGYACAGGAADPVRCTGLFVPNGDRSQCVKCPLGLEAVDSSFCRQCVFNYFSLIGEPCWKVRREIRGGGGWGKVRLTSWPR